MCHQAQIKLFSLLSSFKIGFIYFFWHKISSVLNSSLLLDFHPPSFKYHAYANPSPALPELQVPTLSTTLLGSHRLLSLKRLNPSAHLYLRNYQPQPSGRWVPNPRVILQLSCVPHLVPSGGFGHWHCVYSYLCYCSQLLEGLYFSSSPYWLALCQPSSYIDSLKELSVRPGRCAQNPLVALSLTSTKSLSPVLAHYDLH